MGFFAPDCLQKVNSFSLALFSTGPDFIRNAVSAGVDEIIVDCEHIGKAERQAGADTEISLNSLDDLKLVRASTQAKVICRINQFGSTIADEIEQAIGAGADEILIPMVRSVKEVEFALDQSHGRCGIGILVETLAALEILQQLAGLPLSRVYVGLNDLAIERRQPNIFGALTDGTLELIRRAFPAPFGFGGLTLPERGHPIPCRLLIGEMARLDCTFSFLRRSFHRDVRGRDLKVEIPRILKAIQQARTRSPDEVSTDRRELEKAVQARSEDLAHMKEFR